MNFLVVVGSGNCLLMGHFMLGQLLLAGFLLLVAG